jgi:hypothetical protein
VKPAIAEENLNLKLYNTKLCSSIVLLKYSGTVENELQNGVVQGLSSAL